jgi:nucleoside 2-deoxyribosyltransferase
MNVVLFASYYTAEERESTQRLKRYLESEGHTVNLSQSEEALFNGISKGARKENIVALSTLTLSEDINNILQGDCIIGVLNGRVPDESVIIKLGMAYALGVPVVLYKYDSRTGFVIGDNSMILGLSGYKPTGSLNKLIKIIIKAAAKGREIPAKLPAYISLLNDLGEKFKSYQNDNKSAAITEAYNALADHIAFNAQKMNSSTSYAEIYKDYARPIEETKVYCSGPLFCPDEHRTMKAIADVLEGSGFTTYLPERDGAEPYFMGSAGNPMAGSLLVKPALGLINDMIFTIDVKEIIKCRHFIVNLNGRAYDDGAMAELGMAFALGKPVTVYISDSRTMLQTGLHPIVYAVSYGGDAVSDINAIPEAIESKSEITLMLDGEYGAPALREGFIRNYDKGAKYSKFLSKFKTPENKMLNWLEEKK